MTQLIMKNVPVVVTAYNIPVFCQSYLYVAT